MGVRSLNGLLLDTHIWIWLLQGSERLPRPHRSAIESEQPIWLSPVSIWELGLLAARGRVVIPGSVRSFVEDSFKLVPVREAPMTREVALMASELNMHPDPADRFLAATGLVYGLQLVTADERLVELDWLPTL